jgi:hypothetical protein
MCRKFCVNELKLYYNRGYISRTILCNKITNPPQNYLSQCQISTNQFSKNSYPPMIFREKWIFDNFQKMTRYIVRNTQNTLLSKNTKKRANPFWKMSILDKKKCPKSKIFEKVCTKNTISRCDWNRLISKKTSKIWHCKFFDLFGLCEVRLFLFHAPRLLKQTLGFFENRVFTPHISINLQCHFVGLFNKMTL